MTAAAGIPPRSVTVPLRIEGFAVALAAIVAFALSGSSWWLFLLVLAPDLSILSFGIVPRHAAVAQP